MYIRMKNIMLLSNINNRKFNSPGNNISIIIYPEFTESGVSAEEAQEMENRTKLFLSDLSTCQCSPTGCKKH